MIMLLHYTLLLLILFIQLFIYFLVSASHDTEMQALTYSLRSNPPHLSHMSYGHQICQCEVLFFADKLHIQRNIPFKLLFVSGTA